MELLGFSFSVPMHVNYIIIKWMYFSALSKARFTYLDYSEWKNNNDSTKLNRMFSRHSHDTPHAAQRTWRTPIALKCSRNMTRRTPLVFVRLLFESVHATKHNFFISQCHRMCGEVIKIALKMYTQYAANHWSVSLRSLFTFWTPPVNYSDFTNH